MAATTGTAGYGCLLKRGDSGVGAGVKASKTIGASNAQLKILAKRAGTYGNTKTFGIVVSGTSTAYSQVITENSVLINSATDGGGLATTTVLQAIANLYQDATFDEFFDATPGSGTGASVLTAGASGVLSSGAAGTEVFSTVLEISGFSGPTNTRELIDATHTESTDGFREFIGGLKDGGEISFSGNFLPASEQQQGLFDDLLDTSPHNYQIWFTDVAVTKWGFAGWVTQFAPNADVAGKLGFDCTIKVTGEIDREVVV
jgi:hypothetical protein